MEKITKGYSDLASLYTAAEAAGIKDTKLQAAITTHSLPEAGEFVDIELINDGQMSHIRMVCDDGSVCSVSRIRGQAAFVAHPDDLVFSQGARKETEKFMFLKTTVLNLGVPSDIAKAAINLKGRKFTTTAKTGYVVPLEVDKAGKPIFIPNSDSATAQANARAKASVKTFWELHLIPEVK